MIEISKEIMPYWNIGLTRENIARAYKSGNRLNSNCFIVFDAINQYVQLNISDLQLDNGILNARINDVTSLPKNVVKVAVENGHLIAYYNEEENVVSKVDLGNVVGPPGTAATIAVGSVSTGAAGSNATVQNSGTSSAAVLDFTIPRGNTGAKGDKGDDGVTPTFSIENGHLYVDYDNPYTPT